MSPKDELPILKQDVVAVGDLTGREGLVSNVIVGWGAYVVFVITGFVMPRMIDRQLGQVMLGVWDFAWSLVSYFGLVQGGIGSSVNRYIAKYRATGDVAGVNRTVSSASCILGVAGLVVFGLTIVVSLLLPRLFGARLEENVNEAQWVVFFLGASLSVQMAFAVFIGVLTGCHRWHIHNINTSGWHAVTAAGMIVALLLGGRLWMLAAITSAGSILADATRAVLAYRVCQGMRIHPSLIGWETIKKLFAFSGKSLVYSVSDLILNQTTSVLVVAYLGPAALALYARPRSLIHHVNVLINRMSMTLTPTIGSLQSIGNQKEIQELAIKSARYASCMVLPIVLVLVIFGDSIMQLWMGPSYATRLLPAILAVGYLSSLSQRPLFSILAGLNAHAKACAGRFVASACSLGLNILVLKYLKWGLVGTAIAVTLPLTILDMVYMPFLTCGRVQLDMRKYFLSAVAGPVVHALPFAACLVVARLVFNDEPLIGLLSGGTVGGVVLAVMYWGYVLPDTIKKRLSSFGATRAVGISR